MKYNPALDGLRALAIVLVLPIHSGTPGFKAGYIGVDLFFVLSGYLISRILLAEYQRAGTISMRRFYWRRARRLYPAMLFMLAVYWIVAPRLWPNYPHGRDVFGVAAYLMDYAIPFDGWGAHLGHTWSLGVEEKFYLLWPAVLLLCLRRYPVEAVARGLVVAIALSFGWMLLNLGALLPVYTRFDTRLPGLLLGCWLAVASPAWLLSRPRVAGWAGVGLLVVALATGPRFGPAVMYATVPSAEIAAACMIVGAGALPLSHPWFVLLGRLSYGIYLWHYPIMAWMRETMPWSQTLVIGGAASFVMAALSYYTIERAFRSGNRQHFEIASAQHRAGAGIANVLRPLD